MSSLTAQSIAYRAYEIAVSRGLVPAGFEREMVLPMVNNALFRVAVQAVDSEDYREFQKTVTGTVASGSYTLADTTLIIDTIPQGRVSIGSTPCYFARTYDDLRAAAALTDAYWYTLEGNTLQFKNTDGVLGSASGTATIVACSVPTLANLPSRFEPQLVEETVNLIAGEKPRKPEPPAQVVIADATGKG